MIPPQLKDRFAYHFTYIDNLQSIIDDGLLSTNLKIENGVEHKNVANDEIQERRSKMEVTCGPKGVVHDYVPFYFAKRTPMLLNIVKSKNIDQVGIIYFAVPIDKVADTNVVFSDASANTIIPPQFYDKADNLNKLDWDIIDSWSWTYADDDERHSKMAEILVHREVKITDISHIVVWNKNFKNHIKNVLDKNNIKGIKVVTDYHNHFKHHYFTDFKNGNRTNIVTGPKILKRRVKNNIEEIFEYEQISPTFEDLSSAVQGIMNDFCCIKELDDIEGLETDNPIHRECVGKHSQTVAYLVQQENSFKKFKKVAQDILVFSAYLHDIGKGPKSRWPDGIQKVDDDHPRKSLPMLKRILTEDIGNLSKKEIRRIHMLVVYDDLVGDIVANGRDKNQFFQIVKNTIDVDLLISLGTADMKAINPEWVTKHNEAIEALRQEAYDYLGK